MPHRTQPRFSLSLDHHNHDSSRPRLRVPVPKSSDKGSGRTRLPAPDSDMVERLREMRSRGLTLADIVSQWEDTGKDNDNGKRSREAESNDTTPKARNGVRLGKAGRVSADKSRDIPHGNRQAVLNKTPIKPLLASRRQAAQALNCGYRSVDNLIRSGKLTAKHIGWRVMVTVSSLEAWMGEPVFLDYRPVRRDVKAARETAAGK